MKERKMKEKSTQKENHTVWRCLSNETQYNL
jgi:hypothetical protein